MPVVCYYRLSCPKIDLHKLNENERKKTKEECLPAQVFNWYAECPMGVG